MFDAGYKKRLAEDLPRWRDRGWVSADGATSILASLDERPGAGFGLAAVIAVLGVVLIGFSLFAFIGANWDYIPRIFRFALLVLCLAIAYGAGAVLQKRDLPRFADAAVLLGGMVFAGSIALVGQTYHLAGEFADAIMLWLIGVLLAAFLTRSVSGTVLALAGACYWVWVVTIDNHAGPHWGGLAAILIAAALAATLDSRAARMAGIYALAFWIVVTVMHFGQALDWPAEGMFALLACIGLAFFAAGSALASVHHAGLSSLGHDLQFPALGGFLLAAGIFQIALYEFGRDSGAGWIVPSVIALAAALVLAALAAQRGTLRFFDLGAVAALGAGLVALGAWDQPPEFYGRLFAGIIVVLAALWWVSLGHSGHPVGSKIGLFAFGAEVLYLYSVTLGTLIDTALAFLVGGLLFIALSFVLFRLDKRLAAHAKEAAA